MQTHGPSATFGQPSVKLNDGDPDDKFVIVGHGGWSVYAGTTADCDVMISAWTEAKRLLAEAQTGRAIRAIAADLDEQTATCGAKHSAFTCTRLRGHLGLHEAWSRDRGESDATWPQITTDAQIRRDGEALGRRIAADEGIEPKADPVQWPTGLCGHPVPPGAWAAGFTRCRDCMADRAPEMLATFDEAAAPDLTVVDDEDGPQ